MMRGASRRYAFRPSNFVQPLRLVSPLFRSLHTTRPLFKQLSREDSGESSFTEIHRNSRDSKNPLSNISDESGLRTFLGNVVKHMGLGLATTTAVVVGTTTLIEPSMMSDLFLPMFGVGAVGSLVSAFTIDAMKPNYETTREGTRAITRPGRLAAFLGLSTSMGLLTAPMITMIGDPTIIMAAAGISGGMMAGMCHYALRTPKNLTEWGPAHHIGLWTLIGNGVVALFLGVPEPMYWLDVIGGTGLFMGITAYDTQRAIEAYDNNEPDHIGHATNFYLDFMNIFIRILEALAKAQQHNKR